MTGSVSPALSRPLPSAVISGKRITWGSPSTACQASRSSLEGAGTKRGKAEYTRVAQHPAYFREQAVQGGAPVDHEAREHHIDRGIGQWQAAGIAADGQRRHPLAPGCHLQHAFGQVEGDQVGSGKVRGQCRQCPAGTAAEIEHPLRVEAQPLEPLQQPVAHLGLQKVCAIEAGGGACKRALDLAGVDTGREQGDLVVWVWHGSGVPGLSWHAPPGACPAGRADRDPGRPWDWVWSAGNPRRKSSWHRQKSTAPAAHPTFQPDRLTA
jgi:hypothetical protein